jgi:RNA polymerase primary sigma factor
MNKKKNMTNRHNNEDLKDNILAMYLKEISRIPLLSRDEEDVIARNAANGDKEALSKLVQANLRFVITVAKRYQGQGLPLADLISEGNIGLINAVERFDVSKGYHFISYAVWWIRQSILKAICEKSRMIRLPMNRADELIRINSVKNDMQQSDTNENEIKEIARALDMNVDHVSNLMNVSRDMISLDMPLSRNRDTTTVIGDKIEDDAYQSPVEYAERKALQDDIELVLDTLKTKEAAVIRCRYGIGDSERMSLSEIGDQFNLTKERIRQIEKKAIKRLQHPARRNVLQSYIA